MSCDRIPEDLLLATVLGEAEPSRSQFVQEHLLQCSACRSRMEVLRQVIRVESEAIETRVPLEGLLPLLQRQARAPAPTWSLLRRHPSLAAAALALLALCFSAGYVQGKLVGRRDAPAAAPRVATIPALPEPPELGLLAMQTTSVDRSAAWRDALPESVRVAPAVDSL